MKWIVKHRAVLGEVLVPKLVSRDDALGLYKMVGNGGFGVMDSVEKLIKGRHAVGMSYEIWGEDIDDKEVFHRVLKGKLQPQE